MTKGGWSELLPKELGDAVYRRSFLNWGTALVLGITCFTLLLWMAHWPASLGNPFTILAKVSAFSALAFLSMNFLLSTKARWLESLFGGLDRMYAAHCTVGRMSLFWMIVHPLALAAASAGNADRLRSVFLPGADIGHTLGTFSLLLFLMLLTMTVVSVMPYGRWLSGHRLMGLVLFIAAAHSLTSGSDIGAHPALAAWTVVLTAIGLSSYLYSLFLYRRVGPHADMTVAVVIRRNGTVDVLLKHDGAFAFRPGQFVYACFEDTDGQNHPFSVSGWEDDSIRLSIKASGDMTSVLASAVEKGDRVLIRGPYGKFGDKRRASQDDVWVAGGIGISPFLSLLQAERERPSGRKILLIWSYRVHGELPYEEEIIGSLGLVQGLTFVHWNTSERGRLDARSIFELVEKRSNDRRFMMCGPRAMTRSLGKQLVAMGVRPSDVVVEDFNLV